MRSNARWIGLGILVVACAALLAWRLTGGPEEPRNSVAPVAESISALDDGVSGHAPNATQGVGNIAPPAPHAENVAKKPPESAPVDGRVVDSSGAGIPGAQVDVSHVDPSLPMPPATQSRRITDADGRFQFAALWKGRWALLARAEGFAADTSRKFTVPASNVQIVLLKAGTISGTVVDKNTGVPAPNVGVAAFSDSQLDHRASKSGADGKFRIDGVKPGDPG